MEFNKEKWKEKLEERLLEKFSVSLKDASPFEVYRALGETVISFIARDWYETKEKYSKTKQAFYFSSEFLMGRALGNNLINLGIEKEIKNCMPVIFNKRFWCMCTSTVKKIWGGGGWGWGRTLT